MSPEAGSAKKNITRRQFLKTAGGALTLLALQKETRSFQTKEGLFYTPEEMERIYKEEYENGPRLQNRIYLEGGKYIGSLRGVKFEVPRRFIGEALRHLQEMLEIGAAKYIFRLDAFHGHMFIPRETAKVIPPPPPGHLLNQEIAEFILNRRDLVVLYHNSEWLTPDWNNPEVVELMRNRNVVGFFDGRRLQILPSDPENPARAQSLTEEYIAPSVFSELQFSAHSKGEFSITARGEKIGIDLSFDGGILTPTDRKNQSPT